MRRARQRLHGAINTPSAERLGSAAEGQTRHRGAQPTQNVSLCENGPIAQNDSKYGYGGSINLNLTNLFLPLQSTNIYCKFIMTLIFLISSVATVKYQAPWLSLRSNENK